MLTKQVIRQFLTAALLMATAKAAAAETAIVHKVYDGFRITFPEPVVSLSVTQQGATSDPNAEGNRMLVLTGDEAHRPELKWTDQDALLVRPAEGTRAGTVFRLRLKPGTTYLSGREVAATIPDIRCPDVPWNVLHTVMLPQGAGVVLAAESSRRTVPHETLSPQLGVRFTFTENVDAGEDDGLLARARRALRGKGRTVSAHLEPVYLKHGVSHAMARLLQEQGVDVSSLTAEQPLPGCVLVVPDDVLPSDSFWTLACEGGKGYAREDCVAELAACSELRVSTEQRRIKDSQDTALRLSFNAPVRRADLPAFFRALVLRVGGAAVAPAAAIADAAGETEEKDGVLTRSVTVGGQTVRFIFDPAQQDEPEESPVLLRNSGTPSVSWSYEDTSLTQAMVLRVEAAQPCTVEAEVPAGALSSALGLPLPQTLRHRQTLGTYSPRVAVGAGYRPESCLRLLREGDRRVELRAEACSALEVEAYRWSPEAAVRHHELFRVLTELGAPGNTAYEEALHAARVRAGLTKDSNKDALRRRREERLAQQARYNAAVAALTASGESLGKQTQQLPAEGRYASAVFPLSLDALAGGKAAPGLYVLRVRALPNPQAQAAAEAVGLTAADVAEESVIFLNVTGLCGVAEERALFVYHHADGSMAQAAEVHGGTFDAALHQGFAELPPPDSGSVSRALMMVVEGDDVLMLGGNLSRKRGTEPARPVAELLSDRELYRPGETVHLFGLLRRVEGNSSVPLSEPLVFTLRGPDRKKLLTREIVPDAYGAFDLNVELPNGEEDVTGAYHCLIAPAKAPHSELASCTVRAEVFRRDSFDVSLQTEMNLIAPDRYRCTVTARDYNGTPLSGAKVTLKLDSNFRLGGDAVSGLRSSELAKTLRTGEDGTVSYECPVSPFPPRREDEAEDTPQGYVSTAVTVSNDREEVRQALNSRRAYFADFRLSREGTRLRLFRHAEGQEPALDREQTLHGVLTAEQEERTPLPNGFVRVTSKRVTLWEGDVTFPAGDTVGQTLPYDVDSINSKFRDVRLVWTGSDAAGRAFRQSETVYYWVLRRNSGEEGNLELREEEGLPVADTTAEGPACLLVESAEGTAAYAVHLAKGVAKLNLPEGALPDGASHLVLMQPRRDASGAFCSRAVAWTPLFRSSPARALDITAELSAEAVAPGGELTVRGRVCRRSDSAAAKARVLLFAVDEGMLSVAGHAATLPDWERCFSSFRPSVLRYPDPYGSDRVAQGAPAEMADIWAGLWQGEWTARSTWQGGNPRFFPMLVYGVESDMCSDGAVANKAMGAAAPAPMLRAARVEGEGTPVPSPVAPVMQEAEEEAEEGTPAAPEPAVRRNFTPLAVWTAALESDAEGRFESSFRVPDTLTRYKLFCVAADADGNRFGNHEASFEVRQAVMLTPGTPLFMSTGDRLLLPLTVTNATDTEDTWQVQLSTGETQSLCLGAKRTGTLYFEVAPQEEGEQTLRWTARAAAGSDAVEGSFPVRFPAPLLKEKHHLVLAPEGQGAAAQLAPASLLAPELAESARGELSIALSANPLLHLAGFADFALSYPYGCTEQISTGLLPWLLYERLAPFCPQMAETPAAEVGKRINESIAKLLKRQQADGGLSYWEGCHFSSFWASAHAALILTYAAEQAYEVPQDKMNKLRDYLRAEKNKAVKEKHYKHWGVLLRYEVARVLGEKEEMLAALREALQPAAAEDAGQPRPFYCCLSPRLQEDARLLLALHGTPDGRHAAFLTWMRSRGRDYRHPTTWTSGWTLIALREYVGSQPAGETASAVRLSDGRTLELGNGAVRLTLAGRGQKLGEAKELFSAVQGTTYVNVEAKAQPSRTEYPGVTEKGLQITRLYEKKDAAGAWVPATEFAVGDVVRVTLTCAKVAPELEYLVLEDYLPACMEAVNPAVPSQAAGIEFVPWSAAFDNKEYLADRVRGFCTRWGGRNLLNMVYFARVKRAGVSTAPPAQAQLMYEPQIHGLSPNAVIISK